MYGKQSGLAFMYKGKVLYWLEPTFSSGLLYRCRKLKDFRPIKFAEDPDIPRPFTVEVINEKDETLFFAVFR